LVLPQGRKADECGARSDLVSEGAERIRNEGISNIDLLHRARDVADEDGAQAGYVRVLDEFADRSLDFIYRNYCAVGAVAKVKPGGLLVVDNVNWFLPSRSLSPTSPTLAQGPVDQTWQEVCRITRDWRSIWSSNGVCDTLILFKS
jgi:hypothetical protein